MAAIPFHCNGHLSVVLVLPTVFLMFYKNCLQPSFGFKQFLMVELSCVTAVLLSVVVQFFLPSYLPYASPSLHQYTSPKWPTLYFIFGHEAVKLLNFVYNAVNIWFEVNSVYYPSPLKELFQVSLAKSGVWKPTYTTASIIVVRQEHDIWWVKKAQICVTSFMKDPLFKRFYKNDKTNWS